MNRLKLLTTLLTLALTAGAASMASAGTIWSLEGDFSTTANPNGAWSYGIYQPTASPTYGTWPPAGYFWAHESVANLSFYGNPYDYGFGAGAVAYNPGSADAYYGDVYHLWLRPGEVGFFAPVHGEAYAAVIRWTAPEAMTVSVDALFTGRCDAVSSDVHVLLNGMLISGVPPVGTDPTYTGTSLMAGNIDGNYGCADMGIVPTGTTQSQSYSDTITVAAGDHIDFVVNYGSDHANSQDLVGLSATITTVPEPTSLSLLGFALAGLLAYAWRRK